MEEIRVEVLASETFRQSMAEVDSMDDASSDKEALHKKKKAEAEKARKAAIRAERVRAEKTLRIAEKEALIKEALKKARRLANVLREMGTINKAEKEALWDAEDDVHRLTKALRRQTRKRLLQTAERSVLWKAAETDARLSPIISSSSNGSVFSCLAELRANIASRGIDAFVADLYPNPNRIMAPPLTPHG